ncbi:MAG: hypothetical protein H7A24_17060 [Leptospiraceae bacterium]|nr:hypothetical protein [Leptospiraceae bacterium]MCP5513601.1 hypothetical protein [Leptospiraceae bacterium]
MLSNSIKIILILLPLFLSGLGAQGRADFYDNYDYSLRNYKGGESTNPDYFQEYDLPPQKKAHMNINPKSVQKPADLSMIIPSRIGIRRTTRPSSGVDLSNSPINPFTGDLNVNAILKNQDDAKRKTEERRKRIKEREVEIYTETSARRKEIIFFTTLPFAMGISIVAALGIDKVNNGFYKSNIGALFVVGTAASLSATNVYLDSLRVDKYEIDKRTNPKFRNPIEFSIPFFQFEF